MIDVSYYYQHIKTSLMNELQILNQSISSISHQLKLTAARSSAAEPIELTTYASDHKEKKYVINQSQTSSFSQSYHRTGDIKSSEQAEIKCQPVARPDEHGLPAQEELRLLRKLTELQFSYIDLLETSSEKKITSAQKMTASDETRQKKTRYVTTDITGLGTGIWDYQQQELVKLKSENVQLKEQIQRQKREQEQEIHRIRAEYEKENEKLRIEIQTLRASLAQTDKQNAAAANTQAQLKSETERVISETKGLLEEITDNRLTKDNSQVKRITELLKSVYTTNSLKKLFLGRNYQQRLEDEPRLFDTSWSIENFFSQRVFRSGKRVQTLVFKSAVDNAVTTLKEANLSS